MKKMFTLVLAALFISAAGFAAMIPGRLTISSSGNSVFRVIVDGNRFDRQTGNSMVFDNMLPGFHTVKVFAAREFGWNRRDDREALLYSGGVSVRPACSTILELNNRGVARITEIPMPLTRPEREGENRFDRDAHRGADRAPVFARLLRTDDFYAAQRAMDRENDRGRMLYASRLVSDYAVTAIQVKTLAAYFRDDADRFQFARVAFAHTIDKNNFPVVGAAFRTERGRNELFVFLHDAR